VSKYQHFVGAAVDETIHAELTRRSVVEDRTVSNILRAAIKLYIRRHPRTTKMPEPVTR